MFSRLLGSNVLWTLAGSTLVEITGFCQSTGTFLDVSTFRLGNISVITCARGMAAVLGGATGELVCNVLVDAGFFGYEDNSISVGVSRGKRECLTGRRSACCALSAKASTLLNTGLELVAVQILLSLGGDVHQLGVVRHDGRVFALEVLCWGLLMDG